MISLPDGGGEVDCRCLRFSPDLVTGMGRLCVPIVVPEGRPGARLALTYSTGTGNGPFGVGWQLNLPGVSRKTSRGVPRYVDGAGSEVERADVFLLTAPPQAPAPWPRSRQERGQTAPPQAPAPWPRRTGGLFERVERVRDASGDFWEACGEDGTVTRYGTARPAGVSAGWRDPAVVADPRDPRRVAGWRITESRDPLGGLIRYDYLRDQGEEAGHSWDQPLIARISYAAGATDPSLPVAVEFEYESRPDSFSDHRSGFELRTSLRCRAVRVVTRAADGVDRVSREYRLGYQQAAFNGASLLSRIDVVAVGDQGPVPAVEHLPPLTFGYAGFDPAGRRLAPVSGPGLPVAPLSGSTLALVDLRGVGLPDVVELGAAQRFWRNAGGGRFELARRLAETIPFSLGEPGVHFMDADGDGRPDLVVSGAAWAGGAGYFPMAFATGWRRRSFQPYRQAPNVGLSDANVRLVDLDGDGLTDVLRSGTRLECWFNDANPRHAWARTAVGDEASPEVDLTDPRVRLADMTGDGLSDIVLLRNGDIAYWPNLGHGRWGALVTMRRSPRLPAGVDPRRVLLGDVDGDGAADLVYVDHGRVLVWGNRSGNGWSERPTTITGTPDLVDTDEVQFADLRGTGIGGLLFSGTADGSGRPHLRFLDFTGGTKPYLLAVLDNHLGTTTRVSYGPSTEEFLRDQDNPATRWRTTLPYPVHVVTRIEVLDATPRRRLTTRYQYRHGYWDAAEREFRGFARVEQLDSETDYPSEPV